MGRFAAIMFGLILCLFMPSGARADWYDGAWSYRRNIQVTNSGSEALTDYATAVNLQTATFDFGHAAADGADLRFTDSDEVTPLGFWIQDYNPGLGQAKVWVKIPSLPANSTRTIYVYYGNPSATTSSDGALTFSSFAGFEENFDVVARTNTQNLGKMACAPEMPAPLIPLGAVGEFDHWGMREHGNVLYEPDEPNPARRYKTWYSAIGDSAYSTDRISWLGQAISPDGYNWTKLGRVSTTIHGEDPYVVHVGDTYYLYYEGKTAPYFDDVSLMTSPDGINWTYVGAVIPPNPNYDWMDKSPSSPTVWLETSEEDTTWYCYFEGKGNGPNRGGGSIGLATSTDGYNFTVYGSDPIIPLGSNGEWDSQAMVPDCIYRENGLYWLIYHGISPINYFWAGYAYSPDLIHWTKVPAISGNPNITTVGDPQVFWDADGRLTATMCPNTGIYRGYLFSRDSTQWPYSSAWTLDARGGQYGLASASGGFLHLSGESFQRASTNLVSTQRWTNGFEIEMRMRAQDYGSQVYTSIAIGSGNVVDMNTGGQSQWETTALQSGYLVWISSNAVIGRMPASGGKAVLAQFPPNFGWLGNYNIHRLVYDRSDVLKWYIADTLRASVHDTTWASNQKRVLISQGELTSGAGGIQDIDWIFVRQQATLEPTTMPGPEQIACVTQVLAPNGGETLTIGDSITVLWTGATSGSPIRIELSRAYPNGTWELLADSTVNDGAETFVLSGNPSPTCRVRTMCLPWGPSDVSDVNFSLVAPHLPSCGMLIIAPNGGEVLTIGNPMEVQWSASDPDGLVRIELNRDCPQGPWELLADSTANDGTETFAVAGNSSVDCRVRVTCLSLNQNDTSDSDFMLIRPQQILSLPTNANVVNGCNADFQLYVWASMTNIHDFDLQYRYDPSIIQLLGSQIMGHSDLANEQSVVTGDTLELDGIFATNFSGLDTLMRLSFRVLAEVDTTVLFTFIGGQGHDGSADTSQIVSFLGSYSTLEIDATPPLSPAQVTLQAVGGPTHNDSLRLCWSPVTRDLQGDPLIAPIYSVYFSELSDSVEHFVGSTFDTTLADTYSHGMDFGPYASGQYIVLACKTRP